MVLTKQDLQEWNSHPVTKAVFSKIKEEVEGARIESSMMETVDQTALRTAYKEGFIDGATSLSNAYEDALEEAD
jgi:hypothetical protein